MPTKFMKLGFDEKVLQGVRNTEHGYALTVGLNYYRGTPISAVERLELRVDGEEISSERLLIEINGTFLRIAQIPLAFTEYWGVRHPITLHVHGEPLSLGEHDIDLTLEARVVYMEFAPGVFGHFDGSARATLSVSE